MRKMTLKQRWDLNQLQRLCEGVRKELQNKIEKLVIDLLAERFSQDYQIIGLFMALEARSAQGKGSGADAAIREVIDKYWVYFPATDTEPPGYSIR